MDNKKTTKKKKIKKEEKYKIISLEKFQKIEMLITLFIGVVFLILLFLSMIP